MKKWLITGFILVVLAALGWRLFTDLERYEKTVYHQASRAAREDPYLAFRRWAAVSGILLEDGNLLMASGYPVVVYDLQRHNPDDLILHPMFLPNFETGHICIIVPSEDIRKKTVDSFLAPYLEWAGLELQLETDSWLDITERPLKQGMSEIGNVTTGKNSVFIVENLPEDALYIRADEEDSYLLLSVQAGDSRLTITGDPLFLQNPYIGTAGNADLAWRLISGSGGEPRILFMVGPDAASVLSDNPWIPWIASSWLAALLLLTWAGTRRPDSLVENPPPVGSDIGRRLAAEGEFLRKNSGTAGYVEAGRLAIRRKLRRRGWGDPTAEKPLADIASATGLEPPDLQLALGEQTLLSPAEYLRVMRTLYRIEEAL